MSWFSRLFESVHSYNQRHLKHIDDCIAHVNKCIDNCRLDGNEDLIPKHEQAIKLWHEARALVASGQGELADGIKHAAWMLYWEASAIGTRRLQIRLREALGAKNTR